VAALTASPTKGQECVVPAKRERHKKPAPFDQSHIRMQEHYKPSPTVYEIHSRSPIIAGCLSEMEALGGTMPL
jgi:hypothetical protein